LTSMLDTATRYGVHGQHTIHELHSFYSTQALPMSRGMIQQFGVVWGLREHGNLDQWKW
jgi:hypothetical protein